MRIINIMLGKKRGGIEQACVSYCEALQSKGHEVLAIIGNDAAIIPELKKAHIAFTEIYAPYTWNILAYRQIKKLTSTADMVIVHGNRAGKLTRNIAEDTPVIAVTHSRFFKLLPHFSGLITIAQSAYEKFKKQVSVPVFSVPNFVHVPDYAERPDFRNPPVIGMMGRFSPEKGIDILIDALAILRDQQAPFKARIGGSGGIEEELKKKISDLGLQGQIEFCGWVSDKRDFLQNCDIYCLPSRTETFPITLLEAMAYGCPSVATACGGPSEMIQDGVTGLLADIDAASLAGKLQDMLGDPQRARNIGVAGREYVTQHFSFPVVADKLDGIVQSYCTQ